jgi:DNA polymerase III alpha subunit
METKKSLTTNKYGQVILSSDNLIELLLQGKNISHLNVKFDDDIELFKQYQSSLIPTTVVFLDAPEELLTFNEFHQKCSEEWMFPEIFQQIDVKTWLHNKCKTQQEHERVDEEFILYEDRDLVMALRMFIFLVDYMRKNKIVWGVGRGSSVSSYILYLIGIHRVNSLKYELSISDFLR